MLNRLAQLPLFSRLNRDELSQLEPLLRPVTLPNGQYLFYEDEIGASFYILLSGKVEIIKAANTPEHRVIAILSEGTFVGEIGIFGMGGRRAASVRALGDCHLLEITDNDLRALLERHPTLVYEITRELNIRLRETNNAAIRDLQQKNLELQKAYEELRSAQAQLIEKEKLERELQLAKEIQQGILPRSVPELAGFSFGSVLSSARAVGGDLYDFVPLDENRVGVMIGDVSDKGIPSAIFMALTRSLVRAEAVHSRQPWEVLHQVNHILMEISDSPMFVTMLYGVLDRLEQTFSYARAGHELPLFFDHQGQPLPVPRSTGQPLCMFSEMQLDTQVLTLPVGGGILLYSDGLTDAMSPKGEFFGVERVWEVLQQQAGQPAPRLCQEITHTVQNFQPPSQQYDDISLIAITRSPESSAPGLPG